MKKSTHLQHANEFQINIPTVIFHNNLAVLNSKSSNIFNQEMTNFYYKMMSQPKEIS